MILDRVTITGADTSVDPAAVLALGRDFPFVEWGILVSKTQEGNPRFPDNDWIMEFIKQATPEDRLALHICGRWVRAFLLGQPGIERDRLNYLLMTRSTATWGQFRRVQLNFHAEPGYRMHESFLSMVEEHLPGRQLIFQIDGVNNTLFYAAIMYGVGIDAVPLFDVSGGAGVVPKSWPRPIAGATYHGYAGGLGPDTLEQELPRIAEAAGDTRIWIDMETRVRSENDRVFDLAKVQRCLEICEPFVETA